MWLLETGQTAHALLRSEWKVIDLELRESNETGLVSLYQLICL
jgi:hypothetical protein